MSKPEELVAKRVTSHIRITYPFTPFRFDLTDKIGRANGIKHKELMGKWSRGYPDLFIAQPCKLYHGMYLEIKEGKTPNNAHTREQAVYHQVLRNQGYYCEFGEGYQDCIDKIDTYMKLKRKKVKNAL
jgi:hypothetical protein